MPLDSFQTLIPGNDGVLYSETKPKSKTKTAAQSRPGEKVRDRAKRVGR